jgi:hypothetical protein
MEPIRFALTRPLRGLRSVIGKEDRARKYQIVVGINAAIQKHLFVFGKVSYSRTADLAAKKSGWTKF